MDCLFVFSPLPENGLEIIYYLDSSFGRYQQPRFTQALDFDPGCMMYKVIMTGHFLFVSFIMSGMKVCSDFDNAISKKASTSFGGWYGGREIRCWV